VTVFSCHGTGKTKPPEGAKECEDLLKRSIREDSDKENLALT